MPKVDGKAAKGNGITQCKCWGNNSRPDLLKVLFGCLFQSTDKGHPHVIRVKRISELPQLSVENCLLDPPQPLLTVDGGELELKEGVPLHLLYGTTKLFFRDALVLDPR